VKEGCKMPDSSKLSSQESRAVAYIKEKSPDEFRDDWEKIRAGLVVKLGMERQQEELPWVFYERIILRMKDLKEKVPNDQKFNIRADIFITRCQTQQNKNPLPLPAPPKCLMPVISSFFLTTTTVMFINYQQNGLPLPGLAAVGAVLIGGAYITARKNAENEAKFYATLEARRRNDENGK
jgi:hypothetical protein